MHNMQVAQWTDGWLQQCNHLPSPNFAPRSDINDVSVVVLHNISLPPFQYGQGAVQRLFTNQITSTEDDIFLRSLTALRVSSHFFVERDGKLTQFVSCNAAAYQAGVSCFKGREGCNDFSIGIELEGCDFEPYTAAQYAQLTVLLRAICSVYPIQAVTGHEHIAPGRKTDPGHYFQWDNLRNQDLPVVTDYQWPVVG
ncbi:MAG: 1,6-anhydro-N-acetylmuramyl-L-alanine amidase AmpD [Snodgrassella sp.]|jgi:N-acetyl-anhydromuramoyl-L-alanine amidase|nr:1,6-anhydro-N-acetylmuramyl-L-alanine amidase AmpD [Snodgrassella sp.]